MIPSVYSVQQEVGALVDSLAGVPAEEALRAVSDRIQLRQFERVMLYKERFDDCGGGPPDAPGGVEKVAGR